MCARLQGDLFTAEEKLSLLEREGLRCHEEAVSLSVQPGRLPLVRKPKTVQVCLKLVCSGTLKLSELRDNKHSFNVCCLNKNEQELQMTHGNLLMISFFFSPLISP